MKTCCPNCRTIFLVTAEQLGARAGRVRCGQCRTVFSGLERLLADSESVVILSPTPPGHPEDEAPAAALPALPGEEDAPHAEAGSTGVLPAQANDALPADLSAERAGWVLSSQASAVTDTLELPRAARELPGDRPWLGGVMSQAGGSPAATHVNKPFAVAVMLLVATLAGQLVFHFRTAIAITLPGLQPALEALSGALGSDMPLPRDAEQISIEASDLQSEPGRGKLLALQVTLHNRASHAQAYPALDLALTDTSDRTIARRVLLPDDYLPPTALEQKAFAPNADLDARLWLDVKPLDAAGYRLYVFYP